MSFDINKIKEARSRVKSGADFPNYVKELGMLGIKHYDTYLSDGHTSYEDIEGQITSTEANYRSQEISNNSDKSKFKANLEMHQQCRTDYPTFCIHAAESGVEKWRVDLKAMTCTYYDKEGNIVLQEQIPSV